MSKKVKHNLNKEERIYELSTLVAGEFSLQEALDKLAEAAVNIAGVKACSIRLLNEEVGDLKMRSTYGLSEEYRNKGVVSKDDPVIKAAFAGAAVILDDMRTDPRVQYPQASTKEGLVSQLTVAMQFRERPIGVLRLYSPEPKHFSEEDIYLARAVASQCAVAITNAGLYAQAIEGNRIAEQMRLAGIIQRRMIPQTLPKLPGFDVAATYIPCFDIGGDFYDFIRLSENTFAIVIADVIGKGIPAAIMMSLFRGAVRAYADTYTDAASVKNLIARINKLACAECRSGEFVTFFYAVFDMTRMTVTYCNCGHEPTVMIRKNEFIDLNKGGLVLGVEPDVDYQIETVTLQDEDCLIFYTDGLIDAVNFEGLWWGRDQMLNAAKLSMYASAEQMIKQILTYRRRFVGLASQIDDTSIVVVKTHKPG